MSGGINVTVSSTAAGVNVSGGTAATIAVQSGVGTSGTSVAITVSGGIGPAGFITAPGSATNAFGVFQLTAGDGITISTSAAQFQIASYGTASLSTYAPVQSVAGRTGVVTLTAGDITAGTFDTARIPTISYTALASVPVSFAPSSHTHDASAISAGTLDVARIPAISYTALSNVPATFSPSTHTHSQSQVLPAQAGYAGPLVTDGTTAAWTSRYSIVSPVIVQGDGMSISRDTTAGTISIAFAGGTSGLTVGTATPQQLGTASAGTSSNASREDHVHKLPTVSDITAASAVHSHAASDVTAGTFDIARIPAISYTALSNVPVSFTPSTHTHSASDVATGTLDVARLPAISYTALTNVPVKFAPDTSVANVVSVNGITGTPSIVAGANVTVTTAASSITIAAASGGGTGSFSWASVPASSTASGTAGDLAYNATHLYVATASNTWKRTPLSTWAVDSNFASVSLLLHFDGIVGATTFIDSSSNAHAITRYGNASLSVTQAKFNLAVYFDGSDDRLSVADDADFDFGTGDFTVEAWIYKSASNVDQFIVSSSGNGGMFFGFDNTDNLGIGRTGTAWDHTVTHGIATNTWAHVAVCRSGSSLRFFVDGVQKGSTFTNSTSYDLSTTSLTIASQGAAFYFTGYLDELRITKGVARYTAGFTAPTAAFPDE